MKASSNSGQRKQNDIYERQVQGPQRVTGLSQRMGDGNMAQCSYENPVLARLPLLVYDKGPPVWPGDRLTEKDSPVTFPVPRKDALVRL